MKIIIELQNELHIDVSTNKMNKIIKLLHFIINFLRIK